MHQVAVIGAGRMGQIHARNAARDPRLALRWIVDPAPAAATLAEACGAEVATMDRVLADDAIEGVVVASSTDTHLELTLACVAAGKAVFCEKPLDLDLAKAEAAGPELTRPGVRLLLGFNRRFDPHFRALKARVASGAVGRLESINIVNHDPASPPPDFVPRSGGLFKDFTIHDLDMARWLLEAEPAEVFATASCLVDPEIGRQGDVDTAKVVLKTVDGRLCAISNTRRSGCGYDQRVEAFGAEGMARVTNLAQAQVEQWGPEGALAAPIEYAFVDRYRDSYRLELEHFAAVVAGEAEPRAGYHDSLAALRLAEACAASAREGRAVRA